MVDVFSTHKRVWSIVTGQNHLRRGVEKRENNGGDEANRGTLYHNKTLCTTIIY
jgi:hypothetical protein